MWGCVVGWMNEFLTNDIVYMYNIHYKHRYGVDWVSFWKCSLIVLEHVHVTSMCDVNKPTYIVDKWRFPPPHAHTEFRVLPFYLAFVHAIFLAPNPI